MRGTGCAETCADGLVKCGGLCLPGADDAYCCLGPTGHGTLCGPASTCCQGICGAPGSFCCEGPTGTSDVCAMGDECCDGVCMAEGTGCAAICATGLVKCGG